MLYNLTELRKYSKGDNDFELEIIQTFLDETPRLMSDMKSHLENNEWKEIRQLAHKFKSSVDVFEMRELRELLDIVEKKEEADIRATFPKIETMVSELLPLLILEKNNAVNK